MKNPGTEKSPEFAVPPAFLEQFGLLLEKGVQRLNEFQKETLKPLGLTGKHLEILLTLEKKGFASPKAISANVHTDPTTLADLVGDLEKLGMVDSRSNKVTLTDAGKGILSQRVRKSKIEILSGLTPQEQKTLVQLIRKLVISQFAAQKK
jgi:DNA-binding MarR family transcriptional regulator